MNQKTRCRPEVFENGFPLIKSRTSSRYVRLVLCKNGKASHHSLHRLIAITFIPNPENKPCVNHINGLKKDNRIENLEWCTNDENMNHAKGLDLFKSGESNPNSKLTFEQVEYVRKNYVAGENGKEIARILKVNISTVYRIVKGEVWAKAY